MQFRLLFNVKYVLMAGLLMASCGDNPTDTVDEASGNLKIENVSTTAFTCTLNGQFKGITNLDVVLGKHGVLYCVKSNQSESLFKSWKNGNDDAELKMYTNDRGFNGESYTGIIDGLLPDTEYSFCLFSQTKDKSVREISDIHSFKTLAFNPEIKEISIKDIQYIDAGAEVEFGIDALDARLCEYGVMLSDRSGIDINTVNRIIKYTDEYDYKISIKIKDLKPDRIYYNCAYVKYRSSEGKDDYLYGPEGSFMTMTSDQMWVDLGLPSGIKWANCDLGGYIFSNNSYSTPCYMWGSLKDVGYHLDSQTGLEEPDDVKYEQLDDATGSYKDIGSNISGTEYDVAKQKLGGKWRMPTVAEVEELISSCGHTSEMTTRTYTNYGQEYTMQVRIHVLSGNGNEVRFIDHEHYWCGDAVGSDMARSFQFSIDKRVETINYWDTDRMAKSKIRPVWDPSMPDE
ncbi:MAG: hypothetical protein MJY68_07075 [Bacteroidaceae bacterium]|nr:hypothetical protein [Bacteroidaceae bacterium]